MLAHILAFLFCLIPGAHAVVDGRGAQYINDPNDWMIRQGTVKITTTVDGGSTYSCTGVQVSRTQILTAGHCLTKEHLAAIPRGNMTVAAYDYDVPGRTRRLTVNAGFSEYSKKGDIAILQVAGVLPSKIFIPLVDGACDPGTEYLGAGYGITEANVGSDEIRLADLQRASHEVSDSINNYEHYSPKRLVLEAKSGRPCNGDSGGPVFCRKRGHLAVAGIYVSRSFVRGPSSTQQRGELCRQSGLFVVTSVTATMDAILKWQRTLIFGPGPNTGSARAGFHPDH